MSRSRFHTWLGFGRRVAAGVIRDRVLENAASVTFFVLLSIFPGLAVLVSAYGLFAEPSTLETHLRTLTAVLPEGMMDVVAGQLRSIVGKSGRALGVTAFFGLVMSLWSTNSGIKALFDALNAAYGETERRGFLMLNAVSLAYTLGAIVVLLLAMGAIVVVPAVLNFFWLDSVSDLVLDVLRWPALFIVIALGVAALYRYGAYRTNVSWRGNTVGSAFAALGWIATSMGFSWYAANIGKFNETYGALGAVVGFMTWIWFSVAVVLVGAEIDAELTGRKKTTVSSAKVTSLGANR